MHLVHVFMQFRYSDFGLLDLFFGFIAQLFDLVLVVVSGVRLLLLVLLLQIFDFVVQLDHSLHAEVIVLGQPKDDIVTVPALLLVLVL